MSFFTDSKSFTHRGRFYGIPVYFSFEEPDGMSVAGTNIIFDWMTLHVAPFLHWCCETVLWLLEGEEYEPRGWRMEVLGELNHQ